MVTTVPTLDSARGPGVYVLDTRLPANETAREIERRGFNVVTIDGAPVSDKEAFLRATADAMRFPAYYGANWDAFEECLTDLSWLPAKGYVLLLDRFDRFAASHPSQWETALDILRSAVEHWQGTDTPMYVLLRGMDLGALELPTLRLG